MDNAKIQEVNARLKRGEGWIGYRTSKGSNGEKLPSKFLYFAFYQGSQQKFVNSKTNDPEEAYRQLLDARRATSEGVRLLPSEVSRIRYEDLRAILLDYYREHKPGKLYETGNFVLVNQLTEVSPGIFLVRTVSQKKGTLELPELTLAIKRSNGLLLVDGCSHAGIEAILEAAKAVDPRTEIVFGGLHLVTTPVEEIDALVENLRTKWKVQRIAPGHCTGEPAFARLRKAFGEKYVYAGLGTVVSLE